MPSQQTLLARHVHDARRRDAVAAQDAMRLIADSYASARPRLAPRARRAQPTARRAVVISGRRRADISRSGAVVVGRLGQPVVVETAGRQQHIPSRRWSIAPDGYTLLFVAASAAVNVTLSICFRSTCCEISRRFGRSFPAGDGREPLASGQTISDLVAHAKANPGKISMASFGTGSTSHVAGELFKMMTGVKMITCPIAAGRPWSPISWAGRCRLGSMC